MMPRLFCGILVMALALPAGCMGREVRPLYPYRVICGESRGKLAERMAEWMRVGWLPTGGVEVVSLDAGVRWCQAITKKGGAS